MNMSCVRRGAVAVIALAVGAGLLAPAAARAGWSAGAAVPDLKTFNLEGQLPAALAGHVVLVDFWASWCGPCKSSFPVLGELHHRYADKGLLVLGVSVDETAAAMNRFLEAHPAAFTIVRDTGRKLVAAADVQAMPTSFLIDRRGRIRFVHTGFHGAATEKQYVEEIEMLLKEQGGTP
jgi:thiol-disulfide isomerase/thioredoxin